MSLSGCQINLIDVNFHLQKSMEIFGKNSSDKVTKEEDGKCPASCQLGLKKLLSTAIWAIQKGLVSECRNVEFNLEHIPLQKRLKSEIYKS